MSRNLTTEQRIKVVEFYFFNLHSIELTQRAYKKHFNTRTAPHQTTINRLIARFRQQGALADLPRSGRPRIAHNQANIDRVRQSVEEYPEISRQRRSEQLGISKTSLQRILSGPLAKSNKKTSEEVQVKPQKLKEAVNKRQQKIDQTFEELHRAMVVQPNKLNKLSPKKRLPKQTSIEAKHAVKKISKKKVK